MDRMFSIFMVSDYKGGELSTRLNVNFNSVVAEVLESGNIKHDEIGYWEELFEMDEETLTRVLDEASYEEKIYAGGDDGTVIEIFEHKDNKLVSVNAESFLPHVKDYIMKRKG